MERAEREKERELKATREIPRDGRDGRDGRDRRRRSASGSPSRDTGRERRRRSNSASPGKNSNKSVELMFRNDSGNDFNPAMKISFQVVDLLRKIMSRHCVYWMIFSVRRKQRRASTGCH